MVISNEEVLHIANLARLSIAEDEVEQYKENLQNILDFAEIVINAPVEDLEITIAANETQNIFRKDEVKVFEDNELLFVNSKDTESNMFKIPKVL